MYQSPGKFLQRVRHIGNKEWKHLGLYPICRFYLKSGRISPAAEELCPMIPGADTPHRDNTL